MGNARQSLVEYQSCQKHNITINFQYSRKLLDQS